MIRTICFGLAVFGLAAKAQAQYTVYSPVVAYNAPTVAYYSGPAATNYGYGVAYSPPVGYYAARRVAYVAPAPVVAYAPVTSAYYAPAPVAPIYVGAPAYYSQRVVYPRQVVRYSYGPYWP
jgi:hypothetical protein